MASFAITLTNKAWDILVGASRNYTRQDISQPAPNHCPQWKIVQDVVMNLDSFFAISDKMGEGRRSWSFALREWKFLTQAGVMV